MVRDTGAPVVARWRPSDAVLYVVDHPTTQSKQVYRTCLSPSISLLGWIEWLNDDEDYEWGCSFLQPPLTPQGLQGRRSTQSALFPARNHHISGLMSATTTIDDPYLSSWMMLACWLAEVLGLVSLLTWSCFTVTRSCIITI